MTPSHRVKPVYSQTELPIPSPTTYEAMLRSYLEIGASVSRDLISLLAQSGRDEVCRTLMTRLGTEKGYFSKTVQE
jgi:NADPH-ferrihemoprotein reductase